MFVGPVHRPSWPPHLDFPHLLFYLPASIFYPLFCFHSEAVRRKTAMWGAERLSDNQGKRIEAGEEREADRGRIWGEEGKEEAANWRWTKRLRWEDWRNKEEARGGRWAKWGQCSVPGATSQDENRAGETCGCCLSDPLRGSLTDWLTFEKLTLLAFGRLMNGDKQTITQCTNTMHRRMQMQWKIHANKAASNYKHCTNYVLRW